ncbi:MAG: hypothetical protein ABIZ56_10675 [Chthoniobacteraceae bacterium]
MPSLPTCAHFDLDGAWPPDATPPGTHVDCRAWGPRLRYCTSAREMEAFYEKMREKMAAFTLFGSGDFHHLSALWIRRIAEPFTLVSFDNHPDWDIRPPRWGCGTWINRALELPAMESAAIWGCGNFEMNWPGNLFVNRHALREKRLRVCPWAERLKTSGRRRWVGMTRTDWRGRFSEFARGLSGKNVYVTVDLDCLEAGRAATDWEQGLFTAEDVRRAIGELAANGKIVGGDLCGAFSEQRYARWTQRIAARFDHPPDTGERDPQANLRAFQIIWPALTGMP